MTYQENEKLDRLLKKVNEIHTGLYGIPDTSDKGMCGDLEDLKEDYYKFKQRAFIVFFFILGTGILGTGIYSIINSL